MTVSESAARTFRRASLEARFVLVVWFVALVWTVGWCYFRGYQHPPDSWLVERGWAVPREAANFRHIFGFPDWVLFGIVIPWVLCSGITVWFGLRGMSDDDLGTEGEAPTDA